MQNFHPNWNSARMGLDTNGIGICGPFCRLATASDRNQQNKYPDKDFAGASKIGKFFGDLNHLY